MRPEADVLSLTLPTRGRSRSRRRRLPKPPWWFWLYAALAVFYAVSAAVNVVAGLWLGVGFDVAACVLSWYCAHETAAQRSDIRSRFVVGGMWVCVCAWAVATLVWGRL